jgi:hypothetical protein
MNKQRIFTTIALGVVASVGLAALLPLSQSVSSTRNRRVVLNLEFGSTQCGPSTNKREVIPLTPQDIFLGLESHTHNFTIEEAITVTQAGRSK